MSSINSNIAPARQKLIILTIMAVAILEVLDSTIVNVALPAMQASLGANIDEITWVLTSYIVASAIMIPLTGFLSARYGEKKLLLVDITGFMIFSMLCGTATSLNEIILFRIFQGAFGAAMIPLSQSYMRQLFKPEQQGKAMAIWGIGIMAAPVLGPTLGGYITEHMSWRWIFYVNLPVCIAALTLAIFVLPKSEASKNKDKIDFIGLIFMVAGVSCLQLFLDQGNQKGWLESNYILLILIISISSLSIFIINSARTKKPIINLHVFKDRNFGLSTLSLSVFSGGVFSIITLQPIMLESLFNYSTLKVGEIMAPRGLASALGMAITAVLMKKIGVKPLLITGIMLSALSTYLMTHFNLSTSSNYFIWTGIIGGFSMGLFMVPLSTFALLTIPKTLITEGAGLFSYGRMLGTSIGVSVMSTILSRMGQVSWHNLIGSISPYKSTTKHWLLRQGIPMHSPQAMSKLENLVSRQSQMIAFLDCFYVISILLMILIPVVLLMKPVDLSKQKDIPMGH